MTVLNFVSTACTLSHALLGCDSPNRHHLSSRLVTQLCIVCHPCILKAAHFEFSARLIHFLYIAKFEHARSCCPASRLLARPHSHPRAPRSLEFVDSCFVLPKSWKPCRIYICIYVWVCKSKKCFSALVFTKKPILMFKNAVKALQAALVACTTRLDVYI